ncbi:hypothetical protein KI655_03870 [Vibrio sp. D404a]|uniref:hypothetical protein n=1 Tax=unclassified Vibrio TaxID=2614977 RepID=UPI002554A02E|nr:MULTISPECIES: hypothetical protein [unclassified Vibrio]MDK9736427.1 hypothetical protein [Vibrio sp. D404a]MDK9796049.1 hypothetical protein [Vibrio sp. D449a]
MMTLFITQLVILWSAADPIRSIPVLMGSRSTSFSGHGRSIAASIARFSIGVIAGSLLFVFLMQHLTGGA